ncbi:M23 family metallopeptidase [Cyanobium sp. BA20m-p-22]|uniref:M23 family metallopeptidase n=1 Tax=Cyanobium sp. BA20m-p-22 TaxID=2823704 RepID=UPI0020CBB0A1|nr:M23 family metallopeptidase [Cyanobium sp. BA20m-p-22]MCP9911528.1 M23 family metallopeptidase [Cyanobium sp. BA20m-p-22]
MASWRWPLVLLVWVGLAGPPTLRAQAGPPVPMPKKLPLEVAVADVQPEGALASTSLAPASLAPAPGEAARPPALAYPLKRFAASMDPWGWRYSQRRGAWRMHTGVDLAADEGTPVLAASAGRVLLVESISGYGTTVLLDHGAGLQTLYAHLLSTSVATGQRLNQGEVLGAVGMTGSASGPHLHFELRRRGPSLLALDPTPHLPPLLPPPALPPLVATMVP